MQGVRPVKRCLLVGSRMVFVQQHQVGREALLAHHPASQVIRIVDVVVLPPSAWDVLGPGRDVQNSVRHIRQLWVEILLLRRPFVAQPAIPLVVVVEHSVPFDRRDSLLPSGPPVVRDVQNPLHEHFEVNEDPAAEIFPDVLLVVPAIVLICPVRIALLLPEDGRPTGVWSQHQPLYSCGVGPVGRGLGYDELVERQGLVLSR